MRRQDESKKSVILDFIDEYYNEYNEIPAVRTIAEGTGIALATVHRYLLSLKESGELEYSDHIIERIRENLLRELEW